MYDDVVVQEADRKRTQNFRVFRSLRRDACAGDRAPVNQLLRSAEVQDSIATPRPISSIRLAEWFYITVGPSSSPELVVRFAHTSATERKPPLIARGTQVRSELDGLLFRDDGDLTIASVYPTWLMSELQKRIELRAQFGASRKAPELVAVRWIQTRKALPLSALNEKRVVLLDFWGVWCPSCKDDIPRLKQLQDHFRAEDLQVIGVHSALEAGRIDEFLRRHRYPAPIAIDGGATEKAYAVTVWPTYVLIDKYGRVARYANALPTRAQIQELIDQ